MKRNIPLLLALLALIYLPTMQTIPNGSSHRTMIDVGETQIVLNTWGTLHATGYPHYVIVGNIAVALMRLGGVSGALAPGLFSLLWGLLTIALLTVLINHLTGKWWLGPGIALIYGLTRFMWLHQVIAEIYSFGHFILIALYILALWRPPIRHRIEMMALVGGIGVAHHRGIGLLAVALLIPVADEVWQRMRHQPWRPALWLGLGLLGFLPYLYLPLRADADWVYGDPSHWHGFWDQFNGTEANHFFHWPDSFDQFQANFDAVNRLLVGELSTPAIVLGLVGLVLALVGNRHRRTSAMLIIAAGAAYGFSTVLYYDILATLILTITTSIAIGWALLVDLATLRLQRYGRILYPVLGLIATVYAGWLYIRNIDWIHDRTHDQAGLETIDLARQTPPGSTLMLAWGPRHFAVGFAKDVTQEIGGFRLVDHNADFAAIVNSSRLVTPEYTFYAHPADWWEMRIGAPVYLRAIAPYLVEIDIAPEMATALPPSEDDFPIIAAEHQIYCDDPFTALYVEWLALEVPDRPLSVMVHILDSSQKQLAEADQLAPVYGWRPVTTWEQGEIVRDVYPLPEVDGAASVRFGFYESIPGGGFRNYRVTTTPLGCEWSDAQTHASAHKVRRPRSSTGHSGG